MPLHLKELQKHTEQNEKIIELLTKLTETQQPKAVLNKNIGGVNKNESRKPRLQANGKSGKNSNK